MIEKIGELFTGAMGIIYLLIILVVVVFVVFIIIKMMDSSEYRDSQGNVIIVNNPPQEGEKAENKE